MPAAGEMTIESPSRMLVRITEQHIGMRWFDPGIAAQSTMQLRGAHLDLGTAIMLGGGEKTRQRLPEIFSIRH